MPSLSEDRQRAALLIDAGRPADALKILTGLLVTEPDNALTLRVAAMAYVGVGNPLKGLPAARKAVGLGPHDSVSWRVLAAVAADADEPEMARDAALRAVELAPGSFEAHCAVVNTDISTDAVTARTVASSKEALRLAPQAIEPRLAAARLASARKEWLTAEERYLEVLKMDPSNAIAMNNLAAARINQKKHADGAADLIRALGSDPSLQIAKENLMLAGRGLVLQVIVLMLIATLLSAFFLSVREQPPPSGGGGGLILVSAAGAIIPLFIAFALSFEFIRKLGRFRRPVLRQIVSDRSNLAGLILAAVALILIAVSYATAPQVGTILGSFAALTMIAAVLVILEARWKDQWR